MNMSPIKLDLRIILTMNDLTITEGHGQRRRTPEGWRITDSD